MRNLRFALLLAVACAGPTPPATKPGPVRPVATARTASPRPPAPWHCKIPINRGYDDEDEDEPIDIQCYPHDECKKHQQEGGFGVCIEAGSAFCWADARFPERTCFSSLESCNHSREVFAMLGSPIDACRQITDPDR